VVAEIRIPREIHRPVASHWQTLSHIVLSSTPRHEILQQYCFPLNYWNCYTHIVSLNIVLKKKQLHFQILLLTIKLNYLQMCFMLCTTYTNFWSIICPLEVRCLTPLSKIFQLLLLWRKLEFPEKRNNFTFKFCY
jgi:hypothetical protein